MDRVPLICENDTKFALWNNKSMHVDLIEVVGEGGSAIAYKAQKVERTERGPVTTACIVKEYYPEESNGIIEYLRKKEGEDIRIVVKKDNLSDSAKKELIAAEKERQRKNVEQEIDTSNKLFYSELIDDLNSPYVYKASLLGQKADTTYVILDTREGKTLSKYVKSKGGKIEILEAINYVEKILEILINLLARKGYIHGDIKESNIWIQGDGENESICLLDLGSAFCMDDYICKLDNTEEIRKRADKIIYNEGLATSSDGYRSSKMRKLCECKRKYLDFQSDENASDLVVSMNEMDYSVDIYSVIQVLFRVSCGEYYDSQSEYKISKLLIDGRGNRAVSNYLSIMMEKAKSNKYTTVELLRDDLNILKRLVMKEAHPLLLLKGVESDINEISNFNIEDDLFGNIEEM